VCVSRSRSRGRGRGRGRAPLALAQVRNAVRSPGTGFCWQLHAATWHAPTCPCPSCHPYFANILYRPRSTPRYQTPDCPITQPRFPINPSISSGIQTCQISVQRDRPRSSFGEGRIGVGWGVKVGIEVEKRFRSLSGTSSFSLLTLDFSPSDRRGVRRQFAGPGPDPRLWTCSYGSGKRQSPSYPLDPHYLLSIAPRCHFCHQEIQEIQETRFMTFWFRRRD
jgi:hypothetical protein